MTQLFWFYLTYPGIAFHEWAHYTMCRMFGIPVIDVSLWQGHVKHAVPRRRTASFFIAVAPFLSNTITAFLCFVLPHFMTVPLSWQAGLYYFGGVLSLHALPSEHDWSNARPENTIGWMHPFYVLALPLVLVLAFLYALPRLRRRFLVLGLTVGAAAGVVEYQDWIKHLIESVSRWGLSAL